MIKDPRHTVAFFSILTILIMLLPLFILSNDYWNSQPYKAAVFNLKGNLQTSNLFHQFHQWSLTSALTLGVELFLDVLSQTAETSVVAQLWERSLLIMTSIAFSVVFLSCRGLDSIPAVYVGINYCRTHIVLATIFCAVYPELSSKVDKRIAFGIAAAVLLWEAANVLTTYSFYFNNSFLQLFASVIQYFCCGILAYFFYRWMRIIAIRQNVRFIRLDRLTISEYVTVSYVIPVILQWIVNVIWNFSVKETSWQSRSERSMLFHMASAHLLNVFLIVFPGRILHQLAVTNMNLLRLKQIFVRFVSHEIRSPLNVVHAGLDLLVAEIKSADPIGAMVLIERKTAELVIQMFSASESAINILNDLLQYEHIEAGATLSKHGGASIEHRLKHANTVIVGTFSMEMAWTRLANVFENKLGWASILALQKGISFDVADKTVASEFGLPDTISVPDEENRLVVVNGISDESLAAQREAYLHIDIYRIDQVIRNLITNAMKFTPHDGRVTIGISCQLQSSSNSCNFSDKFGEDAVGFLRVEVTDSGVGLSEDEQKNIFGEFTQFNKNKLQSGGGSGLGLWISRRIVHMHKGFMDVTSLGRGCGSTFYFELPLYDRKCEQLQYLALPNTPASSPDGVTNTKLLEGRDSSHNDNIPTAAITPEGNDVVRCGNDIIYGDSTPRLAINFELLGNDQEDVPAPVRVLIVDDSSMNCKISARLIESEKTGLFANATILTADDGTTALECMRSELSAGRQIDFILMDYIMTTMHGPDATRKIREELHYRGIIVGVTGNAMPEDIETFISHGVDEVIIKPLTKAKLLNVLKARYERRRRQPVGVEVV